VRSVGKVSRGATASGKVAQSVARTGRIQEQTMPIDLSTVNWEYVAILAVFAFVAALLGSLIAFRNRFVGAIIAGILFAVIFVLWTYYPHGIPLPISAK
jgi:hypothetical protein